MNSCSSSRSRSSAPLVAALALLLALAPARALPADEPTRFALVASPDVDVESLTLTELSRIVLGQRQHWRPGQPIALLLPPSSSPARRFLLGQVVHMNEQAYRRHTLELMYRGELDFAPKVMSSDEEALGVVAAAHGALALVPAGRELPPGVRRLKVGGHDVSDAAYPLRGSP